MNEENGHAVGVDLETGVFLIGDQILHASEGDVANLSFRKDLDYRLIYATRHRVFNGIDDPSQYLYLVGWQYTHEGKNTKRILYIEPNGEVVFGGE